MKKDDKQLVVDYLSGNEDSLNDLINRYLKPVYNFIYRLSGDQKEAEDLAQESFFRMWKNLSKYHQTENFKTWLFTIARNVTIDFLRKKKSLNFADFEDAEGENALVENLADPAPLPDEVVASIEKNKLLDDLLNKLPLKYREVLLLHYLDELTFDEIGKVLKKPLDTVKSQYRRALIALKKTIDAPK